MLDEYREKRDFARTTEPPPDPRPSTPAPRGRGRRARDGGPLTFVVQKHAARRLHYDFRLELDGALKSWSVPKGPSLDPKQKRLAVMVEDHPLEYASFEGVIPRGEYGAGQVIVWDNGTYSPDEDARLSFHDRGEATERMRRALAKGKLSIFLRGHKLKGSWTLVKTKTDWLLIKHQDEFAGASGDIVADGRSVLSGLTIKDLKAGRLPRRPSPAASRPGDGGRRVEALPGARKAPFPAALAPMLASLSQAPFSNADWLFEPKLDGVRVIALIQEGKATLLSRRGLDVTAQYPAVAEALARQPEGPLVLDGEIVALDERGVPSFQLLQQRLNLSRQADIRKAEAAMPVIYYVFDLLHDSGYDLSAVPLERRQARLRQALLPSERVRYVEEFEVDGDTAYEVAVAHGLEGVVAKRRDSPYESGKRSRYWLKVKAVQSDEFVVGGYSQGLGSRAATFGALILGYYDHDGGLVYVGHVGSGFDDRTLVQLRQGLDALKTDDCPFAQTPPLKGPVTWLRPELVAEVKFAQWTAEGHLRAPIFLRLREDKAPSDCTFLTQGRRVDDNSPSPGGREIEGGGMAPSPSPSPFEGEGTQSLQDAVADLLNQLANPKAQFTANVQGHRIRLNNLDKEFWPALPARPGSRVEGPALPGRRALTKRDLIIYFARVAPYLLPHMKDRPLTLTRYPDGIHGEFFYQKRWENPLPPFVETVRLYSSHNEGDVEYILVDNLPTLIWLGQLADLELHTWFSRTHPEPDAHHLPSEFTGSRENIEASVLNYPDFIVFDLDPYIYSGREGRGDAQTGGRLAEPELNRKAFARTCDMALHLKDLLDGLSLSSFLKTSGRTGLHIYVPILRQLDYDAVRSACQTVSGFLLRQRPREVTMEWAVDKRAGKVFLDHNQNARGKTLASVYSPRPLPEATVSMPLRWDELGGGQTAARLGVYPTDFTILTAPDRLAKVGDLWAGILDAKQDLQGLLEAGQAKDN